MIGTRIVDTITGAISTALTSTSNNGVNLDVSIDGATEAKQQADALTQSLTNLNTARQSGIKSIISQKTEQLKTNVATKASTVATVANTAAIKSMGVAAKVASVGMTALKVVAGSLITAFATIAISKFIGYLYETSRQAEITAENAEALRAEIDNLNKELRDQQSFISDNASRYEELSEGVDNLGRNVSLTTEEYKEYNSIVNDIADMFPELVTGYTEEGNAILSVKGNVEALTEAYKENQKEKYQALLSPAEGEEGVDTLLADARNKLLSSEDFFGNVDLSATEVIDYANKVVEASQKGTEALENLWMETVKTSEHAEEIDAVFRQAGINSTVEIRELDSDELASFRQRVQSVIQQYQAELDQATNNVEYVLDVYFKTNEHYDDLDTDYRDALLAYFDNIDTDIALELSESPEAAGAYVNKILENFENNSRAKNAFVQLFTLDRSNIPVDESEKIVDDYIDEIIKVTGESKEDFIKRFNEQLGLNELFQLDDNIDNSITNSVNHFRELLRKELYDLQQKGDVSFFVRPEVNAEDFSNAGWNDQISNLESSYQIFANEDKSKAVVVTPVLPDGTVLSPEDLQAYANKLLNGEQIDVNIKMGMFEGNYAETSAQSWLNRVIQTQQQYFQQSSSMLNTQLSNFYDENILTQDDLALWESIYNSANNAIEAMEKFKEVKEEINNTPLSFGQTISQLDEMSSAFDSIDEVYADFADGDKDTNIDFNDYASLKEELGDVEGIDNYIKAIQEAKGDTEATQEAFDNLATALINQKDIMGMVTEENADLIQEYLELKGVANANEIVMAALAEERANAVWESQDLTNATAEEINALAEENGMVGQTKNAFAAYIAQKMMDSVLDTGGDIQALANVVNALGLATNAWTKYYQARQNLAQMADNANQFTGVNGGKYYKYQTTNSAEETVWSTVTEARYKEMQQEASNLGADYAKELEEMAANITANYSGGTATQSAIDKAGSKAKDEAEKQFDWIETRLERLKAQREELNELGSSSIVDFFGISQEDLDRAKELFSMSISPGSQEVNELFEIAERAKMSIGELQQLVQSSASANNRESYLQQVLNKDRELIETNKLAIAEYKAEYDNVKGLVSPEIQAKIESGDINIEEYSGDEAENIEKVQDAYEKYSDAIQNQRDYETQLYEDTRSYYENRINYINAQNEAIENSNNLIQAQMDYMQEARQIVTASSYEQLIDNLDKQIALMEKRKKEQEAELQALISSEDFDFGEDSEAYYELQDAISETDSELLSLKTSQEEYNNTLLQMPIDNMDILLNMYQSITTEIENWGATLEASGKKLNQNYYQTLINNGMEIIDQYEEQADLIEDVMDEYDEGSDQWNELYDRLQNVNSEMSSMVQNLYEWNEALLQLPLDSINDYADNLQQIADAMSEVMSEYNTVIDAVVGAIDNEIDAINDEKDDVNDAYQDRIDALQDQLDLLDEQNEKKQLQLDLEQAQYELEQLRNQKTIRVIRDGRVTYENDADAIRDAQDAVDDAEYNIMRDELEGQIEDLQNELDDINERYDDQIERLEEIANKWEEIRTNVEQYNKELIASDYLGEGWQDKVISGNDQDIYEMFKNMYESLNNQQNAYNEQIENTQNISELLNSYIEAYKEGTITYQEAMTGMKDVLSQINEHTTALDNLQNILDFSGASNDTANNAESVLGAIQDSLTETANELLKSFETYNENSGLITEYTSSWEQLTNNVDDIKDTLEDVRDNLEDALEEARDRDEEEDDDDDDRGNRGATGLHSYKGPLSYDKGIANGLVGSGSESSREDKMKLLGLRPLDEDEVRAILHKGEAVFNPDQQNQLFRNFETAYNAAIPKITMPNIPNITPANTSNNVEISMGDVILPNVQDVDGFAKAMGTRFGAVMRQEFGRNIK